MPMRILKPFNLGVLYRLFEDGGRYFVALTANVFFAFSEGTPPLEEMGMWTFLQDEFGAPPLLDVGMPKPRGEALVLGRAYAPEGQTVPAREVALRLGPLEKRLFVFGDRRWERGAGGWRITDPEPFAAMPVDYFHAFGGPQEGRNPTGRGHPSAAAEGEARLLPNVEYPERLVGSPDDTPPPAGFHPLDMMWADRFAKVGSYGEDWLRERFPGHPADFDWSFYNTAPADQQIDGFFRGDETFSIAGMHPARETVGGVLPGVVPRLFMERSLPDDPGTLEFVPVELRAETVWLFPHAERGILAFRGMAEAASEDGDEIRTLVLGYERLGEPLRPVEHYRVLAERERDPEDDLPLWELEKGLLPERERSPLLDMLESTENRESMLGEGILNKNLTARMEEERAKQREMLESAGVPIPESLSAPLPDPNRLDLEGMDLAARQEEAHEKIEADTAKIKAAMEKVQPMLEKLDMPGRPAPAERIRQQFEADAPPPSPLANKPLAQLREAGAVPEELGAALDALEPMAKRAAVRGAHYQPPPDPLSPAEAEELRARFVERFGQGKSFAGWRLDRMPLAGLDLSGIDLAGASLIGADLRGATLREAKLDEAILAHALLEGADLTDATVEGANFGHAVLQGAILEGAKLGDGVLQNADCTGARLRGADLTRALLPDVLLREADLADADLGGAALLKLDCTGACFARANLEEANLVECVLEGADLGGARMAGATLLDVRARRASFREATLSNLTATGETDLREADLAGATIEKSSFLGQNLAGACLDEARLSKSNFMKCRLAGARLRGAVARETTFRYADWEGADAGGANLREASLHGVRLVNASLRGANCYGVDFHKATFGGTDLAGAILHLTLLQHWRPS